MWLTFLPTEPNDEWIQQTIKSSSTNLNGVVGATDDDPHAVGEERQGHAVRLDDVNGDVGSEVRVRILNVPIAQADIGRAEFQSL